MKNFKQILKVLLPIITLCLIGCSTNNKKNNAIITQKDTLVLKNLKEVLWPKAYREQDTVLLGQILDDSFQMIE